MREVAEEELFHEREQLAPTQHEKILMAKYRELSWEKLRVVFSEIEKAVSAFDENRLQQLLKILVPEARFDLDKQPTPARSVEVSV